VAKAGVPKKKTRAARAPVISKDELRNQIEKLTAANVTLKTKGREIAKAFKAAEARIEVLEHQISQTEAKAAIKDKPVQQVKTSRKTRTLKTEAEPDPQGEDSEEAEGPLGSDTV
jgi:chromosome segregation ATPase